MRANLAVPMRRALLGAIFLQATAAAAQLPSASPAAFAMAGNYTAMARGYEAVAINPANLGMPGRPFFSFGTAIVGGTVGLEPVDFKMMGAFSGQVVDSATRAGWVNLVQQAGRERFRVDGGITELGMSIGPIGLHVGTSMYSNTDLSPDAFEAFMFGNAGNNNGQAKPLDLTGTGVEAGVISAAGASLALSLPISLSGGMLPNEHLAIAVTGKYVMGHGLVIAKDNGSVLDADSMRYNFPMIGPAGDSTYEGNLGVGTGADISLAWSAGKWRVGLLAANVMNTFKWDTSKIAYIANSGEFTADSSQSDDVEQPFSNAPQALQDLVTRQAFKPSITIGAAMNVTDFLTVTMDFHQQTGGDEAISIGPKSRTGIGAELRIIPFVPLRAGVAQVTDGWQAGAGFGIRFLGYEIGVSGSLRRRGQANEAGAMIGLVGIGH